MDLCPLSFRPLETVGGDRVEVADGEIDHQSQPVGLVDTGVGGDDHIVGGDARGVLDGDGVASEHDQCPAHAGAIGNCGSAHVVVQSVG